MKVYALTVHKCRGAEDSTDTLIDVFARLEDAQKAMDDAFNDYIKDIDLNQISKANGEKIWSDIDRGETYIYLSNENDGWSFDHIHLDIVEKEIVEH